jgi:hypothetical protein
MASRSKSSFFARFWAPIAGLWVLLLAPALVNLAMVKWEHARNPVPGAFYEVDGAEMHINCTWLRIAHRCSGACSKCIVHALEEGPTAAFASNPCLLLRSRWPWMELRP